MPEPTPAPVPAAASRSYVLEALLLAVAFAVAHTQSPLYYSNQNQYFVHGLANGGHVNLSHDWLAGTTDPTPVFTALVAAGYKHLGEWSFQAAYFALLMAYFLSVRWLTAATPGVPDTRADGVRRAGPKQEGVSEGRGRADRVAGTGGRLRFGVRAAVGRASVHFRLQPVTTEHGLAGVFRIVEGKAKQV